MSSRLLVLVAALLALGGAQESKKEVVTLSGDARIEGTVVKETAEAVFVDVGYSIIEVPKRAILSRRPLEDEVAGVEKQDGIFFTARLKKIGPQELADQWGEAVVQVQTPSGLGSGFVVNEKEGYIVTNNHVIQRETRISVTFFVKKGNAFEPVRKEKVRIVALSPFLDLALLQVDDREGIALKKAYLGESDEVKAGDPVFAIGNPMGLKRTISEGIVSIKAREMEGLPFIQTTAPINPGNSGGPLFNDRGEVIGVNSRKAMGAGIEGLGFAIPATYIKEFLKNREAYSFDKDNPNTGVRYLDPPRRRKP